MTTQQPQTTLSLQQIKMVLKAIKNDSELIQLFADINTTYYQALIKNGFSEESAAMLTANFDFLRNK